MNGLLGMEIFCGRVKAVGDKVVPWARAVPGGQRGAGAPESGVKVRFGVVEAINGNMKWIMRRVRGYGNLRYLLLKAQHMAASRTEFMVLQNAG